MGRILLIGPKHEETRGLAFLLRGDGHQIDTARKASDGARLLLGNRPDLLVFAVADPEGLLRELSRPIGSLVSRTPAIAVVPEGRILQTNRDLPGLLEILPTPFSQESFLARVDALLRVREVLFGRTAKAQAGASGPQTTSTEAGAGPLRAFFVSLAAHDRTLGPARQRPLDPYLETAASIVGTVEERDSFQPGHAQRVAAQCANIAAFLGLRADESELLVYAASVHDIGKIALSAELLRKPSFTENDRRLMRYHPRRGADLIRALTPYNEAADVILYHHERPDGKGYYGRGREDVPVLARVLAVADVFDGMTSSRSAQPPLTPEQAVDSLKAGRGVTYDSECVDAIAAVVRTPRNQIPLSSPQGPGKTPRSLH